MLIKGPQRMVWWGMTWLLEMLTIQVILCCWRWHLSVNKEEGDVLLIVAQEIYESRAQHQEDNSTSTTSHLSLCSQRGVIFNKPPMMETTTNNLYCQHPQQSSLAITPSLGDPLTNSTQYFLDLWTSPPSLGMLFSTIHESININHRPAHIPGMSIFIVYVIFVLSVHNLSQSLATITSNNITHWFHS